MKKGLILTFEFPPHPGGIGTYAYQIALNFDKMGIPIAVFATPNVETDEENSGFDQRQPFSIHRFSRASNTYLKFFKRLWELIQFCRQEKPQWIFACSNKPALLALFCKIFLGIPYFLVGYGTELTRSKLLNTIVMKQATGLIAISDYTAQLMQAYTDKPISVIPLGADVDFYQPNLVDDRQEMSIRQKYNIYTNPVLLSVGGIKARKGYDVVLKALVKIKEKYPEVLFIIAGMNNVAGQQSYETSLQEFIMRNDIKQNVKFIVGATRDELRVLYKLADISVLASRDSKGDVEGFGIVAVEANAMGTAVVASNHGGIVDAVEDGRSGLLFESENSDDLAVKVLRLLNDTEIRQKMGDYGQERANKVFNWHSVAQRTWADMQKIFPQLKDGV